MHTISSFLFLSILLFYTNYACAQPSCCDDPICREETNTLAERTIQIITNNLTLSRELNESTRSLLIDTLQKNKPDEYRKLINIILILNQWAASPATRSKLTCFNNHIPADSLLNWITFLQRNYLKTTNKEEIKSIEFARGLGLHVDINSGGLDFFLPTESYLLSSRILLSYTIAGAREGGKSRLLIGPSFYYWQQNIQALLNPRYEFRLKDLSTKFGSILNYKLIFEANVNNKYLIAGGGLGVEIGTNFGAQVLTEFVNVEKSYLVQIGGFYRFKLTEK